MWACAFEHLHAHLHVHVHVRNMCMCMWACGHVHVRMCMCMCVRICHTPNATRRTELALMVAFATSSPEISCFKSHAMRCDAMRIPEFPGTMVAKATVVLLVVSMQPCTKVTTN